ncbi:MAG: Hsp33 family molecular chaperone HslO [Tissierellia bacterium]|nr:Hsp33 family molecular chaperone HslO [Tissierellia bacterium]
MKDHLLRAMDRGRNIRASVVRSTDTVETARITHQTSPTATAALGRALTAGLLLRSKLKGEGESLSLNIKGNGPVGQILVTGRNNGFIKGYVAHPEADLPPKSDGHLDVGGLVGNEGTLSVVMDLGVREPYVGKVELVSGEIGEDVAHYLLQSEQIPSAVGLGVLVDTDTSVRNAGGFIIEVLPGCDEEFLKKIEGHLGKVHSITELLEEGYGPRELLEAVLPEVEWDILEESDVYFVCECSKEKVMDSLSALHPDEIRTIIDEDHGAEVHCHFCNSSYHLDEAELEEIHRIASQG